MRYAIVYSSKTGNTRLLAEALRETLPREDCLYFGPPCDQALEASVLYVGFWTDKGTCDQDAGDFLKKLVPGQQVFLFGTAGFGGGEAYFSKILTNVRENIGEGVTLTGTYMCQGKMPQAVRRRYEAMEESPRRQAMLDNFDRALHHPDQGDLDALKQAVNP